MLFSSTHTQKKILFVSVLEDPRSTRDAQKWQVIPKSIWKADHHGMEIQTFTFFHPFPFLFLVFFSYAPVFVSFSLLLGLKWNMTLLLITSACQSNFVRQNWNALFWWDYTIQELVQKGCITICACVVGVGATLCLNATSPQKKWTITRFISHGNGRKPDVREK